MDLPLLYKLGKKGELRYWECRIDGDTFSTRYGILKNMDKHTWQEHRRDARYTPDHGSYTSPQDVALEHAKSKWAEKKRNDAMSENPLELGISHEDVVSICNNMGAETRCRVLDSVSGDEVKKRGYPVPIPPVLATRYDKLKERHENPRSKYNFPEDSVYVQYKLDGERCICSWVQEKDEQGKPVGEPGVRLFSRIRNEIPYCEHIKAIMTKVYKAFGKQYPEIYGYHFDGEILVPGETRNTMRSAISTVKQKHQNNGELTYYIFDMVTTPGMLFKDRWDLLVTLMSKVKSKHARLIPVPDVAGNMTPTEDDGEGEDTSNHGSDVYVHESTGTRWPMTGMGDDSRIMDLLSNAVANTFEGIILRTPGMPYPMGNHRIQELMKVKPLHDEEVRIVGAHQGIDAHEELIVFNIEQLNTSYLKQDVTPAWSHDERRRAWRMYQDDPSTFVGKIATVQYASKNEYGNYCECRLTRLRDIDDMDSPDGNHE